MYYKLVNYHSSVNKLCTIQEKIHNFSGIKNYRFKRFLTEQFLQCNTRHCFFFLLAHHIVHTLQQHLVFSGSAYNMEKGNALNLTDCRTA